MKQATIDFLLCANLEFLKIWKDAKEDTTKASKKLVEIINGIIKEQDLPMPATGNDHLFKKNKKDERTAQTLTILNGECNLSPFVFWAIFFTYKPKNIQGQRAAVLKELIKKLTTTDKNLQDIIDNLEAYAKTKVLENLFIQIPQLSNYATQCWKLFEALMQDNPDKGKISKYIRKNDKGILDCKNIGIDSVDNILPFIRPDLQFYFDTDGTVTNIIRSKEMEIKNTIELLKGSKQIILTGAPGTGKTYHATEVAEKMILDARTEEEKAKIKEEYKEKLTDAEKELFQKVQFHPGYDYSDFIIGLKPVKPEVEGGQVTFEWKDGVFKEFADKALKAYIDANGENAKPYIFIIDEINRADLSRVFGEVFSLLEEDYRYPNKDLGITLPNGKNFILPTNLYIIGTMNDIDRSVESMDFALRRRFSWKEVTSEESERIIDAEDKDGNFKIANENNRAALQRAMNELNIYIGGEEEAKKKEKLKIKEQPVSLNLGGEYKLGGAYFLNFAKYQDDKSKDQSAAFESLWNNHIAIILNEYLRGRSNREQILSALKDKYDNAWKGNGSNNDGEKDKKKDDTGNPTADSTSEQPKAKEANQ